MSYRVTMKFCPICGAELSKNGYTGITGNFKTSTPKTKCGKCKRHYLRNYFYGEELEPIGDSRHERQYLYILIQFLSSIGVGNPTIRNVLHKGINFINYATRGGLIEIKKKTSTGKGAVTNTTVKMSGETISNFAYSKDEKRQPRGLSESVAAELDNYISDDNHLKGFLNGFPYKTKCKEITSDKDVQDLLNILMNSNRRCFFISIEETGFKVYFRKNYFKIRSKKKSNSQDKEIEQEDTI